MCLSPPHPDSTGGAARDRHGRWERDAMDARAALDGRGRCGRRNRGVLTPRRWCQVSRAIREATVAKTLGTPGSPRISRKPSRRECRIVRRYLWWLPPAFFVAGGPWVRPASGIPCALLDRGRPTIRQTSGEFPPRDRGLLCYRSLRVALRPE